MRKTYNKIHWNWSRDISEKYGEAIKEVIGLGIPILMGQGKIGMFCPSDKTDFVLSALKDFSPMVENA